MSALFKNINFEASSSLIDKDVKFLLFSPRFFPEGETHFTVKAIQAGYTREIHWIRLDNHLFYTMKDIPEDIVWKGMDLFFGNNDFILMRPIQWVYPTHIGIVDTYSERRRHLVLSILQTMPKVYLDLQKTILGYVS